MACARPVIASVDEACSAAKIIQDSGCGITINVGDLEALEGAILRLRSDHLLAENMGKKGRDYVSGNFSRSLMTAKYKYLVDAILSERVRVSKANCDE